MALPATFSDLYGTQGAQDLLGRSAGWTIGTLSGVSTVNVAGGITIDAQGTIIPGPAYVQNLLPLSIQQAIAPWLGTDAWSVIQQQVNTIVDTQPGAVISPDVVTLYQAAGVQLPVPAEQQVFPPSTIPATGDLTPGAGIEPPSPLPAQPPTVDTLQEPPLPTVTPLTQLPPIVGQSGVPTYQPSEQFADWQREMLAVALTEIINNLRPVLPPIFEEQLQLTGVEQDVLRAATSLTEPIVSALEQVTDLLKPAQELIDANILSPLDQVRANLAEYSAAVRGQVVDVLGAVAATIDEGRTVATEPIRIALATAQESLAQVAGLLEATIADQIALANELIAQSLAEGVSSDQALVSWFQSLIPAPETFMQDVIKQVQDSCLNLPATVTESIQTGLAGGLNANLNGALPQTLPDLLTQFMSACGNLKNFAMGGAALGLLGAVVTGGVGAGLELLGGLFNMLMVQGLTSQVLAAVLAPSLDVTTQEAYENCPVRVSSLTNAATALRYGVISQQQYDDVRLKNGYSDLQAMIEVANQRQLLAPQESISWSLRRAGLADAAGNATVSPAIKSITEIRDRAEAARPYLRMQGIDDKDIDKLLDNAPIIPPPSDLLMFDRRDVFDPLVREQFQLFDEFPEDILPLTRMQGLPDEFVKYYHAASWSSPSNTQLYDLYHRVTTEPLTPDSPPVYVNGKLVGYRLIGLDMVDAVFRNNDVLKVFREPLLTLSDRPLTRVDVRRAYTLGAINDDEVLRSYLSQGYSPENAAILLEFAKKERERSNLTEVGEQRRAVAVAFASAYERGIIDQSAYSFALTDLGYQPEIASLAVQRSTLERQLLYLRDVVGAVRTRFLKGKIDREGATAILTQVGIQPTEIERNIDVWCFQIGCDDGQTTQEKEREVTKAEILSFYDDGLIGSETATQRLIDLGYSEADAQLIVANAQIKRLRANLKQTIKVTHDNFLSDTIDLLTASNELDAIGVPQDTRDIMLGQWQQERDQKEIARAREVYLDTGDHEADARAILQLIGLPQDQQDRLVGLWQSQKETIAAATQVVSSNGTVSSVGA